MIIYMCRRASTQLNIGVSGEFVNMCCQFIRIICVFLIAIICVLQDITATDQSDLNITFSAINYADRIEVDFIKYDSNINDKGILKCKYCWSPVPTIRPCGETNMVVRKKLNENELIGKIDGLQSNTSYDIIIQFDLGQIIFNKARTTLPYNTTNTKYADITWTRIDDHSVSLTWPITCTIGNAARYIEYCNNTICVRQLAALAKTGSPTVSTNISNLIPNSLYYVTVGYYGNEPATCILHPQQIYTYLCKVVMASYNYITVSCMHSDELYTVTYCWMSPNNATSYCKNITNWMLHTRYLYCGDSGYAINIIDKNQMMETGCIDNIHANTAYTITIQKSAQMAILDTNTAARLSDNFSVEFNATTHDSIKVTWNTDCAADLFQIEYCEKYTNNSCKYKNTTIVESMSHTITSLKPETDYYIRVEGLSNVGIQICGSTVKEIKTGTSPTTTTTIPTTTKSKGPKESSRAGIYISVAFAILILLGLAIAGFYFQRKKKQQLENNSFEEIRLYKNDNKSFVKKPTRSAPSPILNIKVDKSNNVTNFEKIYNKELKLNELQTMLNEIKNCNNVGPLDLEHEAITLNESDSDETEFYGKEYRNKNRHVNILPFKNNFVKLSITNNDPNSHYINASYIEGYDREKAYIATQGPKPETVDDFWLMIWEQNVTIIAMVTGLKEGQSVKCHQYWPTDLQKIASYGNVNVHIKSIKYYTDFQIRMISISQNGEERIVTHMFYDMWPDNMLPNSPHSMVHFIRILRKLNANEAPVVVHCSAGVGRTGTLIMCDYLITMAEVSDRVDFVKCLIMLRKSRKHMISKSILYKLAHCIVLEYLTGQDTSFQIKHIDQGMNYQEAFSYMKQIKYWKSVLLYEEVHPDFDENKERVKTPEKSSAGFIYLARLSSDNNSDYINAVKVKGIREINEFTTTIQPLKNTIGDFWRLVDKVKSPLIMSLHEIDTDNSNLQFWPNIDTPLIPTDEIMVTANRINEQIHYNQYKLTLKNNLEEIRDVDILKFNNWNRNGLPTIEAFLEFYHFYHSNYANTISNVLTCWDGSSGCGVFLTFDFVIRKVKLEQMYDVCWAVRVLQQYRANFMMKEEQYKFIFSATQAYIARYDDNNYENIATDDYINI